MPCRFAIRERNIQGSPDFPYRRGRNPIAPVANYSQGRTHRTNFGGAFLHIEESLRGRTSDHRYLIIFPRKGIGGPDELRSPPTQCLVSWRWFHQNIQASGPGITLPETTIADACTSSGKAMTLSSLYKRIARFEKMRHREMRYCESPCEYSGGARWTAYRCRRIVSFSFSGFAALSNDRSVEPTFLF